MFILFLLCAFKSGTDRFYFRKAEGFSARGREIFFYFIPKNAFQLVAFYFNLYSRKLLLFILCFAPFGAVVLFLFSRLRQGSYSLSASTVLIASAFLLFVNGAYYFIRFNGFFFLSRYYFASGKYFSFRQLFSFSYRLIRGNKMKVLKKRLSFAGWFSLCMLLLPVSFVRSHYNSSMAQLARDLMEL